MPQPLPSPVLSQPGPILQAMRLGEQDRIARDQRGVLQQAGQMAAQGSLGDARNTLLKHGLMQEAAQFGQMMQQADAQQREKSTRLVTTLGKLANAIDSPDKWERVKPILAQQGMDVSKYGYEDLPMLREYVASLSEAAPVKVGPGDSLVDPTTGRAIYQPEGGKMGLMEAERLKAAARARGKAEGEAEAEKPKKIAQAEMMLDTLDAALGDWEAVKRTTGPIGSWIPNVGAKAQRGQSRIDQLLGQTFMQAYQDLKGGGQITENETKQAVDAYTRLQTQGMSDSDYRQAMLDLRGIVTKALRRARGGSVEGDAKQPQRLRYNPATGEFE